MNDLTVFYPEIVDLTSSTKRMLKGIIEFPQKAFVFTDRFCESFGFFIADGNDDDPPIFGWTEGNEEIFIDAYGSIWECLEQELSNFERLWHDL